jgi:hypothetical protein
MRCHRRHFAIVAGCVLAVLLGCETSSAQPSTPPAGIQLGGSAGALVFLPSFGARLSVPLHERLAVEGVAEYALLPFDDDASTWLLFQVQMRQRLKAWRAWHTHVTYGGTFFAKYRAFAEVRDTRPDGSVVVYPAYRQLDLYDPPVVHAGFGAERAVSRSVVLRWDVQALVPIGQISIPVPRAVFGFAWHHGRGQ